MCFATPKMSPPPLPRQTPEPAKFNDEAITAVRDDTIRRQRAQAGATSTIKAPASVSDSSALSTGTKTLLGQ